MLTMLNTIYPLRNASSLKIHSTLINPWSYKCWKIEGSIDIQGGWKPKEVLDDPRRLEVQGSVIWS